MQNQIDRKDFIGTLPERLFSCGEGEIDEVKRNYVGVLHLKIEEVIV
jgi:hypothetical protein